MSDKSTKRIQLHKGDSLFYYPLTIGFLLAVYAVGLVCASGSFNPDSDSYWLVGTGRWIVEHGQIPYINPWTYTEGMSVIVQQPICALLNYIWFRYFGGFGSMWMLACLENILVLLAVCYLAGKFSKSKEDAILTTGIVEVALIVSHYITTRPYQLTIAAMAILIANLEAGYREGKYRRAAIAVFLITLWQANYQMASLFMIPCFISCYFVGGGIVERIRDEKAKGKSLKDIRILKDPKCYKWCPAYLAWFLAGLINPYGIHGLLYLAKSAKAMKLVGGRIIEMVPPSTTSSSFVIAMAALLLFIYRVIGKKDWTVPEAIMVTGTAIASFLAVRNAWMPILALTVIYPQTVRSRKQKDGESIRREGLLKVFSIGILLLGIILIPFALYSAVLFSENAGASTEEMITAIQSLPEESRLYTSFNTGGVAMFAGHKIYVDARPELYSPMITGGEDILQEWVSFEWEDAELLPLRVNEAGWEYYLVDSDRQLCYFLEYSGAGELVCWSDDMKLFKYIPGKAVNVNYGQKVF